MIIKSREISDGELIEAAQIATGSNHPDDYNFAIEMFKQILELLRLT